MSKKVIYVNEGATEETNVKDNSKLSCHVRVFGERERASDNSTKEASGLFVEDEDYVCDISLMRITDSPVPVARTEDAVSCSDKKHNVFADTGNTAVAGNGSDIDYRENIGNKEGVSSAHGLTDIGEVEDNCDLTCSYLTELDIDRQEEEQTISELVHTTGANAQLPTVSPNRSLQVALGIILRLVLPLAKGVVRSIKGIRDVRFLRVLKSIAVSRQALTNLIAFAANTVSMNLSSVQVSHRIEPILKLMKIRKSRDGHESLPDTLDSTASSAPGSPLQASLLFMPFIDPNPSSSFAYSPKFLKPRHKVPIAIQPAAKCCTLNIMAEPPPGIPIRADIIFIHGLHGSQVNTWKQGLWENDRHPVSFERPPKPPVRPPKRPRHSRTHLTHPLHKDKRARFATFNQCEHSSNGEQHEEFFTIDGNDGPNDFSLVCGEPNDIQLCDGVEYSFPTFRVRMNDKGRQLQAELDSMFDDVSSNGGSEDTQVGKQPSSIEKSPKLNPDDPNYSKCWPGDWLPIDCPGVRVIALNYTTDQYLWRPLWKQKEPRTNLVQRAREMAELLVEHRVGYGHPIVWVGHSKGGLFVKQIIVDAWESGRPATAPLWRSARGVFFYSVPHRGSHLASIKAPLLTRSVELLDIEKNNKYLLDLHRRFVGLYHLGHLKVEVFSFIETALTLMSVLYLRIVGVDSADPGIGDVCGIRLDHREICKPRSRDCILYKELVEMINKVC